MTFFIAVFVLFMQFLWKYVDDLIGKGLETSTLVELFFYVTLTTFPLALPLTILLSSLMTFGNLGEQFELVALKSTGMSLLKIMSPLIVVAFLTSVGAFFFSNNMLPYVNLKMNSLLYDIQQKKPAFNIKEGVFYNGIDGYTIRIERKESDGITCHNIMIYDHTQNAGNNKVITSEYGTMKLTADKQFLAIDLFNGMSYEEMADTKKPANHSLTRSKFKEQTIKFDLTGFRLVRSQEDLFRSNYAMLDIKQINQTIDSLTIEKEKDITQFKKNFSEMTPSEPASRREKSANPTDSGTHTVHQALGAHLPDAIHGVQAQPTQPALSTANAEKARVIDMALNIARSKKYFAENVLSETKNFDHPITSLNVEWHKKFSLSLACLVLFFVGAPLGAIIRKGGLGMPVVVSVIIFIFFWVITITGEKMVQEEVLPAHIGMWIATAVTAPLGLFLTVKATSDSSLFDADAYQKLFQKIFRRKI
jgi:lipopolysaccharide export system permease protein